MSFTNNFNLGISIPFGLDKPADFSSINLGNQTFTANSGFVDGLSVLVKYNELYHKASIYLDNSGNFDSDPSFAYPINPSAILNLSIQETLFNWVTEGSITFLYYPEDLKPQNTSGQSSTTSTGSDNSSIKSYQFRGDGYDLLRILIVPQSKNAQSPAIENQAVSIDENDPDWMLSYAFSVFDIEDVVDIPELSEKLHMKCLKLHFRDMRYHILNTVNLEYSTANSPQAIYNPLFDSVDPINQTGGVLPTGAAIIEVLNEALGDPQKGGAYQFGQLVDSDWDIGASQLFYTSPTEASALDDISYLYAHHVSTKQLPSETSASINDLCIMHTKKASIPTLIEPIALTPISTFFEKAGSGKDTPGELQLEHFFVTEFSQEVAGASLELKAPMGGDGKKIDLKTFKYGQIMKYSFVDMSPAVNSNKFCTRPVYSVNIGARVFATEFTNNTVNDARNAISEGYIANLYKKGSDNKKLFLPTIHRTKQNVNVFPVFSLDGDNDINRQKNGILDLIYTGLFQNACICFQTYGLTLRHSGTFIGIDKINGTEDNDYNNKLFGQWFVIKVDHIFEGGAYYNNIYAVKLHRFKEKIEQFNDSL
jgi:hypothetical protein